ncbi:hypothetical protein CDAR_233551 [Caerostris darwini]|uniref:Uncharacterized protein n=1 Tax=Caerostris darwini TaxID=1538125 RepID=A0AAV4X776_9ARAC|nr:hypothetical protein CDAR_233551 [Caerostris darwini]
MLAMMSLPTSENANKGIKICLPFKDHLDMLPSYSKVDDKELVLLSSARNLTLHGANWFWRLHSNTPNDESRFYL